MGLYIVFCNPSGVYTVCLTPSSYNGDYTVFYIPSESYAVFILLQKTIIKCFYQQNVSFLFLQYSFVSAASMRYDKKLFITNLISASFRLFYYVFADHGFLISNVGIVGMD